MPEENRISNMSLKDEPVSLDGPDTEHALSAIPDQQKTRVTVRKHPLQAPPPPGAKDEDADDREKRI